MPLRGGRDDYVFLAFHPGEPVQHTSKHKWAMWELLA